MGRFTFSIIITVKSITWDMQIPKELFRDMRHHVVIVCDPDRLEAIVGVGTHCDG